MSKYFSIFLVFSVSLDFISCQIPFPNMCPDVNVEKTFDLDRYMGTWYEYSKYPFIFEVGQKCQQATYTNEGNDTVAVVNTGFFILVKKNNTAVGTAKVLAPGKLAVAFKNQKVDTPNYLVLGTDYDNWAVVFSCKDVTSYGHTELLWILSRQRQPSKEAVAAATKVIKDNKLSETFLFKSTQTDCPNNDIDDQVAEAYTLSTTIDTA